MVNDRRSQLLEEYERILLEESSGLDAGDRPSERVIRAFALHALRQMGRAPRQELVEQFVEWILSMPHGHQSLLDETIATLERYVPEIARTEQANPEGGYVDTDAYALALEFPTGPFNAQVRPVSDVGHLILINSGLLALLAHATRLMGHSTQISDHGFQYLDGPGIGLRGSSPARALAEAIALYLGFPVSFAGGLPSLKGLQQERMQRVFQACVTFLVAHEYAHVLAGYFQGPGAGDELHSGTREQEVAADWLAVKLLLAPWRWGSFEEDGPGTRLQTLLAGPLFFFALEAVVAEAERRAIGGPPARDAATGIAPPVVRKAMIQGLYQGIFGDSTFPLMDLYPNWIYRMAAEVIDEVDGIRQSSPGSM